LNASSGLRSNAVYLPAQKETCPNGSSSKVCSAAHARFAAHVRNWVSHCAKEEQNPFVVTLVAETWEQPNSRRACVQMPRETQVLQDALIVLDGDASGEKMWIVLVRMSSIKTRDVA
jgi:hypothetical protein